MCLYLGRHRERERQACSYNRRFQRSLSLLLQPFGQQLLLAAENDLSKGILMTLRATTAAAPPRRAYLPRFYMTTVRPHFSLRRSGEFSHPISSSLLSALLSSAPCEEEGEDVVGDGPAPPPTEGLAVAGLGQLQRHRRADGGAQHPLHHLDYLVPHLLWAGELANSNVTTQ